ncbi:ATPase [Methanocaldococcus vulcanius M7]|uniref:ATPase n=1 Tax=Methanocaldococcus vulcanius (strain ATCC 700851 / DSM 12094 / M7) TaxID=579137 RepID=C9RGZ8_METVM|nr:ATP-binding protein [Methanocaldococcus vulcanius]ACX72850.1 ATPase [Methanocaldococcus vulcanius M7]
MKFYNREKELHYLKTYCQLEPNSILFVYGPKSSGKSTVMRRVIKELENSNIIFFYYNLREYATPTKEEFLSIFFEKGKKYVRNNLIIDIKVCKFGVEEGWNADDIKLNDVFRKIKENINEVIKEGKKPVLIIDELQKLKNIYFNGGKSLLNELFNLFVSLTKMEHLCHVICLTSDTLFIDEIYRNSTLKNASEYYLIDWLREETIRNILKEEGFNEGEINYCLNYLSLPYEISQLINNKKLGLSVEQTIKQWINIEADGLRFLIASMPDDLDESKTYEILGKFKDNIKVNDYEIIKRDLIKEFKFLVENEILFYDVINGIIKPTSIIEWHAIREILK